MFVFGWRTAVLTLAGGQVLILAAALWQTSRNRIANRRLAGLLVVLVGMLTPYAIGFAGVYDAFPQLTFAPFAIPLAIGPLAYGYACARAGAPMRAPLRTHLLRAGLQFA